MHTCGNPKPQQYPERKPIPRQLKISRKQEEEEDQPRLDQKTGLLENMSPRDQIYGAVAARIGRRQSGHEHQDDADSADQESAQFADRRIWLENAGKNLSDHEEL